MDNFFAGVSQRWPAGRVDYHWHVLFDEDETRTRLVEPYQELTNREGLAPVPAPWLHLTVLHSAPVDQVSDVEIAAITDRVRTACASIYPFVLTFDRPGDLSVGVECAGRPGASARRLWEITAQATAAVIGDRFVRIPDVFYPHVSLAYGIQDGLDDRPMKAWLSDAEIGPVTLPVARLSLVAQSHDRHAITWTPVAEVPLDGWS